MAHQQDPGRLQVYGLPVRLHIQPRVRSASLGGCIHDVIDDVSNIAVIGPPN